MDPEDQSAKSLGSLEWYYSEDGRQKGPISEEEPTRLIADKTLAPDVPVWRKGQSEWQPFRTTTLGADTDTPPPLSANLINNSIVWVIAFTPVLFEIADAFVKQIQIQNAIRNGNALGIYSPSGIPVIIFTIVLGLLGWSDERRLRHAGYSNNLLTGLSLAVTPVYLFVRPHELAQTPYYGFVWIIIFVLSLLI